MLHFKIEETLVDFWTPVSTAGVSGQLMLALRKSLARSPLVRSENLEDLRTVMSSNSVSKWMKVRIE